MLSTRLHRPTAASDERITVIRHPTTRRLSAVLRDDAHVTAATLEVTPPPRAPVVLPSDPFARVGRAARTREPFAVDKAWVKRMLSVNERRLHAVSDPATETMAAEEGPPPRYFWTGLVLALLVASGPPSIYEMVETKKVTDISVAQVFLGGVVPPVCCLAMLAHAVEAGGALAPGSTWAPSMPAFLFIFGTAAAALHYFAVANEIRLGAALMVLFAYLYYFTSFWLVVV